MNLYNKYPDSVVIKEANLILNSDMRYRDVAHLMDIPLSTVNAHINIRLKRIDPVLYQQVHDRAQIHRHKQCIRGWD